MYIIVEYLLLENFIINYLILYIIKIVIKLDINKRRLFLGGVLSSLYSLVNFYPKLYYLTTPLFKIIISIIIIRISYRYINIRLFLKEFAAFYFISFIFAGTSLGVYFFTKNMKDILNGKVNIDIFPVWSLIFGVVLSIIIIKVVFSYYFKRIKDQTYIVNLNIHHKGKSVKLKTLIDTGNSLSDPLTKKKVIIVEYNSIKELLPEAIGELVYSIDRNNYEKTEELMEEINKMLRLALIPFNSVGKAGILVGFSPDYIEVYFENKLIKVDDITIGIYGGSLSKERGFNGLLQYDLINGGLIYDEVKVQN